MGHILAKLKGVKVEEIGPILKADATQHAEQEMYLEHLWQNADDVQEVIFLFRSSNLARSRQFIQRVHGETLRHNPGANLPQMTFLEDR